MALKDYLIIRDTGESCHRNKTSKNSQVQHNFASSSNRKSRSMPDLFAVDVNCSSQCWSTEHKHPNLQFSTRLASSSVDISSFLSAKSPNIKKKLVSGLKYFKSKPQIDVTDYNDQRNKLDGLCNQNHKSHKLFQPLKGKSTSHLQLQTCKAVPSLRRLKVDDGERWRSEDNLYYRRDDAKLHDSSSRNESERFKIHDMKRVLSHDGSFSVSDKYADIY